MRRSILPFLFTFVFLGALFLLIRSWNLTYLPYYGDEAEYMWDAQTALHDPSQRFISLQVGKQPLYIWIVMLFLKVVPNPLLAGRLVSVIAGLLTMLGIWLLTLRLFKNRRVAIMSILLYIFYPFAQFINRMGNFDSTVAMFYVWSLYFTVVLVQNVRLDLAYTLGFSLAGGILTKTNAFFSIYLLPFSLILFDYKRKNWLRILAKLFLLFGVAAVLANLLYAIQQLSPYYERILWFNGDFVYPKREWLHLPLDFRIRLFLKNVSTITQHLWTYITPSYILLLAMSPFFLSKHKKVELLLLGYWFLPTLALAIFAKGVASRWMFLFTLPLLPLIAFTFVSLYLHIFKALSRYHQILINFIMSAFTVLIFCYPVIQVLLLAVDPYDANSPDKFAFYYCSLWGVRDIAPYLTHEAKKRKIFIAIRGLQGPIHALKLYAGPNSNMIIKGYVINWGEYPSDLLKYAQIMPSYYLSYEGDTYFMRETSRVKVVKQPRYPRDSGCVMRLYKAL